MTFNPDDNKSDDQDRQADDREDVRESYENEECPDCGEPIPEGTEGGEECKNCEHVFWSEEDFLDKKEQIAAIIFDYDYSEEEERPYEESCHNIAEEILSACAGEIITLPPEENQECPDCGEEMKTFMKDTDGTNLEEVFGCPKCDDQ
jgi:predicted RNA-binding Zn-ribbon protein involved in translation (DUF1610 family)